MALEDQRVGDEAMERLIDQLADGLIGRRNLWDEPPGVAAR
jgi:hypothetical protein